MTDSMQRYLTAKRTVDDRALNRRVWEAFVDVLDERARERGDEPVRILELGAGTGTMIARLAAWDALPSGTVRYRAIDRDAASIDHAHEALPAWLESAGYAVEETTAGFAALNTCDGEEVDDDRQPTRLEISLEVADAFTVDATADAVVAAAVLDIVDLDRALSAIRDVLVPGGALYAPVTFDGETGFSPSHPADDRITRLYHRHMDEIRDEPGGSRAGRTLLTALPAAGVDVRAAGGSDWIVRPNSEGGYPADEAAFLEALLSTIDGALAEYPPETLDPADRREWRETRREQLERGELVLVAHHLDVLGLAPDPSQ
ncbi:methyltransferase [Halobacteria archaeon AArc-dxtr1]|nr:methyltransferase [Halobacteria archaeon AArc-dxtr1]